MKVGPRSPAGHNSQRLQSFLYVTHNLSNKEIQRPLIVTHHEENIFYTELLINKDKREGERESTDSIGKEEPMFSGLGVEASCIDRWVYDLPQQLLSPPPPPL